MKNLAILCILAVALRAAAVPIDSVDLEAQNSPCSAVLQGGDGFIQIGNWRFGRVTNGNAGNEDHFSFSSNNGRTAVILRSDGTVHGGSGSRSDWGASSQPLTWTYSASNPMALNSLPNVQFGRSYVQFGPNQRLGTPDDAHLSISFKTPCCGASGIHTADIWRNDGTIHPGPRNCCGLGQLNTFDSQLSTDSIWFGDKFLQIGNFRIADIDGGHMSIAYVSSGKTAEIFRSDSTQHPGPRTDFNANERPKCPLRVYEDAKIAADKAAKTPEKSSDLAKQMVAMLDGNMQKLTNSFNEVKALNDNAATLAAAAKVLFDSISSESAQKKKDMEAAMDRASAAKAQCEAATTTHVSAATTHADAVKTSQDTTAIDKELAVIQQLRDKLVELTNVKALQTANVQLDTSDAVARAVSDASADANLRPSTSLVLAELAAGSGRAFSETADINKLLDQIVAKLKAEREAKTSAVTAAKSALDAATSAKGTSCTTASSAASEANSAKAAYSTAQDKLNARTNELTTANNEAARTLKLMNDAKANYDSESSSFTKMKLYISTDAVATITASKAALESENVNLKATIATSTASINTLTTEYKACKASLATFEEAAKAAAASENTKQTATGEIEDFAAQGLAGKVLVQGICIAIQKAAGWSYAVERPCGSSITCEQACGSESQAGALEPYNAIHMYGNQPTKQAGQPGLKTYRYNSGRGGSGCGPNYCCCGGGGAQTLLELGDASSVEEFLQGAHEVEHGDNSAVAEKAAIDALADTMTGASDLEMEKMPTESLSGLVKEFEQFGAAGQILAQAACTAINPAGGYNFAIIKGCDVGTDCATLCSQAGGQSGSPSALTCKESLHLYQPSWNSRTDTLKVYRYNACGGGCGPNYCCCHGSTKFKLTDLQEDVEEMDAEETKSKALAAVPSNELQMQSKNFVSTTAAQVLAESACTAINTEGGWTFAIRRLTTDTRACQSVCSSAKEDQAGGLKCVDSLSVGSNDMVDDTSRVKLGLMTYKHGNCIETNANYCCCKNA